MVSRSWNQLTPEERAPWDEMARKDKARFELEKSMYSGPWKVPNVKDPKAPKRPVSAFLCFSKERRAQVKRDGPHMTTTQISAVLARMWKEASEQERQKYVDLDTKDRERYRRELEEYNEIASQGRKKREELAFRAIAQRPSAAARHQSSQQDESGDDLSGDSLMTELMNQPLMIDVQEIEEFSSSSSASDTSLDSGMGAAGNLSIDLEKADRLTCTSPAETRSPTGDSGLFWEPLPLAPEAPVSPERSPPQSSVFPRPAVVTPPKLEVQLNELIHSESATTTGIGSYEIRQPEPLVSRSFSTPLPLPSASPWHSPNDGGLMPRISHDTSCFGDYHQEQQGYDTFPYHQISRRSSWDPPSYNNTTNDYSVAQHQPHGNHRTSYISQYATPNCP